MSFIETAHAQLFGGNNSCDLNNGTTTGTFGIKLLCPLKPGNSDLGTIVDLAIRYLLYIGTIIAVFYLLYMGIKYITAGGDDAKALEARKGIINAVIGVVILVLAIVIEATVAKALIG